MVFWKSCVPILPRPGRDGLSEDAVGTPHYTAVEVHQPQAHEGLSQFHPQGFPGLDHS